MIQILKSTVAIKTKNTKGKQTSDNKSDERPNNKITHWKQKHVVANPQILTKTKLNLH